MLITICNDEKKGFSFYGLKPLTRPFLFGYGPAQNFGRDFFRRPAKQHGVTMRPRSVSELLQSDEPLLPELEPYLVETPLGTWVKHPFVIMPVAKPALINEKYIQLSRYLEENPYQLGMYERPFRLQKLVEWWRNGELDTETIADQLAWAWPDMEGDDSADDPFIQDDILPLFYDLGFVSDQPDLLLPEEPLVVYRGGEANGIAWTESLETARWFARRFQENGPVYRAVVSPESILARFWERGEKEVVVDPRDLDDVVLVEPGRPPDPSIGTDRLALFVYGLENHRSTPEL